MQSATLHPGAGLEEEEEAKMAMREEIFMSG